MKLRASFCDPFSADILQLGEFDGEKIIETFESIDWPDYLKRMMSAKEGEIHYSPSLEVEKTEIRHGLSISAVGEPENYEFYIFYCRPKKVKSFFGLREKVTDKYLTDVTGQTRQDVIDCLNALIENNTQFLEDKMGG